MLEGSIQKKLWRQQGLKFHIPIRRWNIKTVWKRSWSPRIHSKTGPTCNESRSQRRTSRKTRRSPTNRLTRWRWSPQRLLVNRRWIHLSSSHWTSCSAVRAERRIIPNPNILTWPELRTRIWMCCQKAVLTTVGMSMWIEPCQIHGQDSRSSLN